MMEKILLTEIQDISESIIVERLVKMRGKES